MQIAEQFQILGKAMRLSVCIAVGGLGNFYHRRSVLNLKI
jgi:hypothetical protein